MNIRKVASLGLAVALQVLPITRVFVASTTTSGSSFAIVSTWIAGALALMGGVDAVSGASSLLISPATATTGVPYSGIVQYSGAHASSVKSWELKNNWSGAKSGCNSVYEIAPGVWLTNVSTYLTRVGGTPTASGTYSFTVKVWAETGCTGGNSDTRTATIAITGGSVTAPTITTQPVNQTVTAGANVSFTVAASGTAPLGYQWKLNGANVTGGTSATLSLTGVTTGQAGSYSCVVTNAAGNATSSAATLTVNAAPVAPSITAQPASQTVTAGANVSFTVAASGTAPLSYQWKLNGGNVTGGTSATLSLTGVTAGQAGSYTCLVTNVTGSATSSAATLTVNPAPVAPSITTQPTSLTVTVGENVSFTVAANGTAPLSYQWRLNGANLGGATSATLSLTGVTAGQAGNYTCVVTNVAGNATSSAATLTVNAAPVAPSITTQPASQTVTAGANVSLTVAASGTAPLSYQWRLNGADISGATSATLSLTGVTAGQAGSYTCLVTNIAGSVTSSAATLTVNPAPIAPSITTQPASQMVTVGANVSFTVAASGTAPLGYQWKLNGGNVPGGTSATLSLTGVTAGQAGNYTCVVSNVAGSATSSAANLTVNSPPTITAQPANQSVTTGANASFTVAASGTASLSYQWRLNGADISGATSATLSLTGVTAGQAGSYTCLVTNIAGSATSSAATLTVNAAPVAPSLTTQPASQTVTAGANVSLTVAASGSTPLSYQWRLNGSNLAGATSATLNLTSVTAGQSGSYSCVVTNAAGSATSSSATLTVNVPPTITTQPISQTVSAGANVSFTVAASGDAPLSYQWQLNGANLAGATSATLNLTGVVTNQSGNYSCLVANAAGSATSSVATLTVNAAPVAPSLTTQPASQTVTAGANVSFMVVVSGTVPLGYQWQLDGANLAGATSATLNLTSVTAGQAGTYSCVVTNVAGSATSSSATLTVNVPPTITTQPASQTVTAGANVSFRVAASGTAPFSYQWRLNGANLAGATSATLNLTGVVTNQSGHYSCLVTNVAGSTTSSSATLTVNAAPVAPSLTTQPVNQTVTAGANVSFTVVAGGTTPLSYQWRLNGANLGGATSATLNLTGVTTNQAGNYSVVVNNSVGTATSSAALLTVTLAPPTVAQLSVNKSGSGTVTPDLSGTLLVVGQSYTLTATPATGYVFAGWTGGIQSSSPTLTFTMTVGLVLQANFTASPYVATAGTYNGLFNEADEVRLNSAGAFNIYADTSGNYSGWVQIGYSRHTVSGQLQVDSKATNVVTRWNSTPLTVELRLGQNSEVGQIFGRVTDGVWTSSLSGGRAGYQTAGNAPQAGEYTVVFPGQVGDASLPAGDSYGTFHLGTDGLGTLSGTLADGTAFSQTAWLTAEGDWPLYVSLYAGKGAVVSWMTFTNQVSSDINGAVVWIKQANPAAAQYPAGFISDTKAIGSLYVAPTGGSKAINLSSASVSFTGGNLPADFSNTVSVNAGSSVVNLSPNALTLTISPTLGSFIGQVAEPGTGVVHPFSGVVLQKQNMGYGFMSGVKASSRVVLVAP